MTRSAVCVACVTLLCLGASSRAQTDEVKSFGVNLTGGFLVFLPTAPGLGAQISTVGDVFSMGVLQSPSGFFMEVLGDPGSGVEPLEGCLVSCTPGDQIGTNAVNGSWQFGHVDLDGIRYTLGTDAGARITVFGGPITVPAFRPYAVVATLPIFVGDSVFAASQQTAFADIGGEGRVSLTFAPASEQGLWDLHAIRYDFGPTPTPTPEPATLTLISGALVAAAIRARTRRERRTGIQLSTSTPTA